ncbi:luciferin 4-monooxygenase-like isoform X2 [Linepithema humile]|uniref:luciferin 4-monooxygenase-like isoform X2 n=1 Tax=Linepithema humile TaxID=83485 RepID=UPI0006238DEF|nr:PREDICTED: luciferin 4-monooxygenase-like isoform X2 [Linepithema humile]
MDLCTSDIKQGFNIGRLILRTLKATPNFVGQVEYGTGRQSTFQEMREKSVMCALWLKKQGIKSNDIVAICTNNHFDAYIPFLACLYLSVIANPWDTYLTIIEGNLRYFLNLCRPKVMFVDSDSAATVYKTATEFNFSTKIVVFGEIERFESLQSILNNNSHKTEINNFHASRDLKQNHTVMILFTSGTTGLPKAVNISDTIFADWANCRSILFRNSIGLWFVSLGCIIGAIMTVRSVFSRVKVIKPTQCFHPENMCDMIQKHKVSWMILETNMLYYLVPYLRCDLSKRYDISSLKYVIFGGFRLSGHIHMRMSKALRGVSVIQIYYTTETGIIAYQRRYKKYDSSGQSAVDVRVKIVNTNNDMCNPMEIGNIYCYTLRLFNSYYKNSAATQNAVDMQDNDGDIFVLDRKVNIPNDIHWIIPNYIENVLVQHPHVSSVYIIPMLYLNENHLMIFVEKLDPEAQVDTKDLAELIQFYICKELMYSLKYKLHFHIVDDIPRNFSGKMDLLTLLQLKKNCLFI